MIGTIVSNSGLTTSSAMYIPFLSLRYISRDIDPNRVYFVMPSRYLFCTRTKNGQEKKWMMRIDLGSEQIECHVEYGPRKKISIELHASGLLIVKAPNRTEDHLIIETVRQYEGKIMKQLHALAAVRTAPKVKEYDKEGQGRFLYLGKYYALHELIDTHGRTQEDLQQDLKKFYFASLKKVVGERITIYQKQLKVQPKSYTIEESSTKWGSCNSSKHLTFNYRLAMAPLEVIDYVVIHELCHILHMDHDRSFWRRVGSVMKDYKEKEAFLARYGETMTL